MSFLHASTSTDSLTSPTSLRRRSSNSYLQAAGTKLQSALTRHYHTRTALYTSPRTLSESSISSVCEPQITGGTTVNEGEWVIIPDDEEQEETDEEFSERMDRERQREVQREGDMLELQMLLWQRWGRPRY